MALWRSRVRAPLGPPKYPAIGRMFAINQSGTAEPLSSLNERGFFIMRCLPGLSNLAGVGAVSQIPKDCAAAGLYLGHMTGTCKYIINEHVQGPL